MEADGTVSARKFIDFADEKDRLWKTLNRIRKMDREHGPKSAGSLWRYAVRCSAELSTKTAAAIVSFAQENHADVIVFEHLDMKGKIRGKRRMRLHMWKKRGVQETSAHMAHRKGMRIARVCAWKTSALAYDGSGKVYQRINKTHAGDGMVRAGGGSPCSTAQKLMRPCGPGQA